MNNIITKKEMYLDICDNPYKRELARQNLEEDLFWQQWQ